MKLRPYQSELKSAVFDALSNGESRLLVASATGTGKTVSFAHVITDLLADPFGVGPVVVMAHQEELLTQAKEKIVNVCGLDPYWNEANEGLFGDSRMVDPVQYEMNTQRSDCNAQVILASLMTVCRAGRMPEGFRPRAVIYDECDRAPSKESVKVLREWGCFDDVNPVPLVGFTATIKRTDKQALFAFNIDGTPVPIRGNKKRDRENCVFSRMVYEYPMLDAIMDRWLVDVRQERAEGGVDLSDVGTVAGDFNEGELADRVNKDPRTRAAITKWKEVAADRQTLVFCASVAHSKAAAELWRLAGVDSVAHVDGAMQKDERREIMRRFRNGEIQILCNYGIVARGVDVPAVSCAVMLRPTKSWTVATQMVGRVVRPLPGVVDGLETVEERHAAIQASPKAFTLVIDVADIFGEHNVVTVPAIVDLPPKLNLQGHSLIEAKELLDKFDETTKRAKLELDPPTTFEELVIAFKSADTLASVHERKQAQAKPGRVVDQEWTVAMNVPGEAYRYARTSVGREALLTHDASGWHLTLTEKGAEVGRKDLPANVEMVGAFATMTPFVKHVWPPAIPKSEQSTCSQLSDRQFAVLRRAGITPEEINTWGLGKAKSIIGALLSGKWKPKQKDEVAA